MKFLSIALTILFWLPLAAQSTTTPNPDPFKPLAFLEGTWDANVTGNNAVTLSGRYSFVRELSGHILARHSTSDTNCKAPANFDCAHSDLLFVFQDSPGSPLKAVYFDSEGHVIHYDVSTPTATSVVFLSSGGDGPQFRLTYELSGNALTGKFQMHMPGQSDWRTYLAWSGSRK